MQSSSSRESDASSCESDTTPRENDTSSRETDASSRETDASSRETDASSPRKRGSSIKNNFLITGSSAFAEDDGEVSEDDGEVIRSLLKLTTSILTYGINYKSAPLALREKLSFNAEQTPQALQTLSQIPAVNEAVILSTCNRTEVISTLKDPTIILKWLTQQRKLNEPDITPYCYHYHDADAVRHLMRVACGLDSMVLGENQILKQFKQAYLLAHQAGTVGYQFNKLFPAVFSASKLVRHQTAIGQSAVSVAYATLQLAKRIYSRMQNCKVLLIGAGDTIELVATHLKGSGVTQITVANRTLARANLIAQQVNGYAIRISDIPAYLPQIDIIITATASQLPILGKGLVESALKQKKRRPLFIADLAVPRDVEPEVADLEDVYLYNIDDLQMIIETHLKHRSEAAKQAEEMIEMQASHYIQKLRILDASDMICCYRDKISNIRDAELAKARQQLQRGTSPDIVLATLAHNLTNKVMHQPTTKLRQAAYDDRLDLLLLAKELFDLT